ncbi:MAG: rotamase, partial [Belnapia sp.]|nr:rotamase [Belnapia sp.]
MLRPAPRVRTAAPAIFLAPALLLASVMLAPAVAQIPPQSQAAAQANRIVAVVNGEVVSRSDII